METRFKVLGHPVHPMLIVFPLGLLASAVIFDVLYLVSENAELATAAYWVMAAGIVGDVAAAIFGLIDWLAIPKTTRARRIGAIHGAGNAVVLVLFLVSFLLRAGDAAYLPDVLPFAIGLAGAAIAVATAWLGGELVYRLRVAVDDDAHLDARSSLAVDGVVKIIR
jgi:uncharacterized membrane protein